jgi:predicted nucleic acid-binding Zn ribbon protein
MPTYKFKCAKCNIDDVKQFLYRRNPKTGHIDLRVCEDCGTPVERNWSRPPKSWYQSIRSTNNE